MKALPMFIRAHNARIFAIGLVVGALGALTIRQTHAISPYPTHTTTRYSLERVAVTRVMTGEPASPEEASKWKESGTLVYTLDNIWVHPRLARGALALEREAP